MNNHVIALALVVFPYEVDADGLGFAIQIVSLLERIGILKRTHGGCPEMIRKSIQRESRLY